MKDKISVIIPCYNSEKYLHDCLNSLLYQTYENIEVILVNDGSTDNSTNIINNYKIKFKKSKKKLIIINQENQGQAIACNNAIKKITGDYVIWQDSDDYYELDAFEAMHNYLIKNSQKDIIIGGVRYIYDDGRKKDYFTNFDQTNNVFRAYLFDKGVKCYPGLIMTRVNFFDERITNREIFAIRAAQNWQLILPLTYKSNIGFIEKIVYNYRITSNSMSHKQRNLEEWKKRFDGQKQIAINTLLKIPNMKKYVKKYYIFLINVKFFVKNIKLYIKYRIFNKQLSRGN